MKIKFTHYITAICIVFMSFTAQAQSKVTHIDFQKLVSEMQLLTSKPTMYIANVDEDGLNGNNYVDELCGIADKESAVVVPVCNKIESEIAELSNEERYEFLIDLGLDEPGLNRVIHAAYGLLSLQTYFTAGPKEARAWTVQKGSKAPEAAGRIHTDFEKGFICAETIAGQDYLELGGEQGCKDAGKMRQEGRDYLVRDGDVILYRFNV